MSTKLSCKTTILTTYVNLENSNLKLNLENSNSKRTLSCRTRNKLWCFGPRGITAKAQIRFPVSPRSRQTRDRSGMTRFSDQTRSHMTRFTIRSRKTLKVSRHCFDVTNRRRKNRLRHRTRLRLRNLTRLRHCTRMSLRHRIRLRLRNVTGLNLNRRSGERLRNLLTRLRLRRLTRWIAVRRFGVAEPAKV